MVRTSDKKSPREAVEFILQLLKYNDNNGNPYSDVFWLAAMVQSVGEFGQQSIEYLTSLLKRLDRLLHFDRLMPSYNGILTISCIRSVTQIAMKLSVFVPLDGIIRLIQPFRTFKASWHVRVEAGRVLLDLEFQSSGIDAALVLFMKYLNEESSLRGQVKLAVHALRLCQMRAGSDLENEVKSVTLVSLLRLLESPLSFNNVALRHHLFCILQVLARRAPTLCGAPRDETLRMGHAETCSGLKNIFAALVKQSKPPEPSLVALDSVREGSGIPEASREQNIKVLDHAHDVSVIPEVSDELDIPANGPDSKDAVNVDECDGSVIPEAARKVDTDSKRQLNPLGENGKTDLVQPEACEEVTVGFENREQSEPVTNRLDSLLISEVAREAQTPSNSHEQIKPVVELAHRQFIPAGATSREPDTVSDGHERKKPLFRFKLKHSAASSRAEDSETAVVGKSQDGHAEANHGASSSVSVDAPQRVFAETVSTGNQNLEDVFSCHEGGSRVTASIGSAKFATDGDELGKELQCTADSSKVFKVLPTEDHTSTSIVRDDFPEVRTVKYASLKSLSVNGPRLETGSVVKGGDKEKDRGKKRKHDEHTSHRDDPEYLERKRLKKEKKRKEKELSKLLTNEGKASIFLGPIAWEERGAQQ